MAGSKLETFAQGAGVGAATGAAAGPMGAIIGGLAGLAGGALNYEAEKKLMQQQQKYYEKNQQRNFQLSQAAQLNSTPLAVAGYKMAGLAPSLMTSPASAAAVPSAPLGSSPSPGFELSQSVAANRLSSAQSELLEQQARSQELQNNAMEDENSTVDLNLRRWLNQNVDSDNLDEGTKSFYRNLLQLPAFSIGSLRGLDGYFNLSKKQDDVIANHFEKDFLTRVNQENIKNQVPQWLSKMPERQYNEVMARIGQMMANTLLMSSETALNSDKADELRSQTVKNYQELTGEYHKDFAAMWENKDYTALFVRLAAGALETALGVVPEVFLFKGAGVAGKAARAAAAGKVAPAAAAGKAAPAAAKLTPNQVTLKSLEKSWGTERANQMYREYIASPLRKGSSFDDFLKSRGINGLQNKDKFPKF